MRYSVWIEGDRLCILTPEKPQAVTMSVESAAKKLLEPLARSALDQRWAALLEQRKQIMALGLKWLASPDSDLRLAADVLLLAIAETLNDPT